jgi:hypothetical protein
LKADSFTFDAMSRLPRVAKLNALKEINAPEDDLEELKCPPPLRQRIIAPQSSSSLSLPVARPVQPVGRGLMLFPKRQQVPPGALNQGGDGEMPDKRNVSKRLRALQNLNSMDSGDSGSESDDCVEKEYSSSSEESSQESDEAKEMLIGKDGTRWRRQSTEACRPGPTTAHNVFRQTSGPSAKAKREILRDENAQSAFSLLVTEQMLRRIQVSIIFEHRFYSPLLFEFVLLIFISAIHHRRGYASYWQGVAIDPEGNRNIHRDPLRTWIIGCQERASE